MTQFYRVSKSKNAGTTSTEFGLVCCLIAGISLLSLTMLGHSISDLLGQASGSSSPKSMPADLLAPKYSATNAGGKPFPYTTSQGTTINVNPTLENNLGRVVLTTGVNGATNILADTLKSIADQLKASGEINSTQYNALIGLANSGHNLASVEATFEGIVASSPNASAMSTSMGQNPSLSETDASGNPTGWYVLGFHHGGEPNPLTIANPMDASQALPATKEFLDAYQTVSDSGALSDPKVKSIIDSLASDISYMSQLVGAGTGQVSYGQIPPDQLTSTIAAQLTHQDSGGICTVGSGSDSGTQCAATPTN